MGLGWSFEGKEQGIGGKEPRIRCDTLDSNITVAEEIRAANATLWVDTTRKETIYSASNGLPHIA